MQKVLYLATLIILSTFVCLKSDDVLGGDSLVY